MRSHQSCGVVCKPGVNALEITHAPWKLFLIFDEIKLA
jgi:hypothetical protein